MAVLIPVPVTKAGVANIETGLVAADVAGDSVPSASGLIVRVANGDASPHTLTVAAPSSPVSCGNLGDLAVEAITLTVAAGAVGEVAIPLGYASLGSFEWTYDAVTSVTVGVISIAP